MPDFFLHTRFFQTERRAWVTVVLWMLVILGLAPVNRIVLDFFRAWGLALPAILAVFVLMAGYGWIYLFWRARLRDVRVYLGMTVLVILAHLVSIRDRSIEEYFHLLEFAALAVFLMKALGHRLDGPKAAAVSLLVSAMFGLADENWQSLIPGRGYDLHDVYDDTVGAIVGIGIMRLRQIYAGDGGGPSTSVLTSSRAAPPHQTFPSSAN